MYKKYTIKSAKVLLETYTRIMPTYKTNNIRKRFNPIKNINIQLIKADDVCVLSADIDIVLNCVR